MKNNRFSLVIAGLLAATPLLLAQNNQANYSRSNTDNNQADANNSQPNYNGNDNRANNNANYDNQPNSANSPNAGNGQSNVGNNPANRNANNTAPGRVKNQSPNKKPAAGYYANNTAGNNANSRNNDNNGTSAGNAKPQKTLTFNNIIQVTPEPAHPNPSDNSVRTTAPAQEATDENVTPPQSLTPTQKRSTVAQLNAGSAAVRIFNTTRLTPVSPASAENRAHLTFSFPTEYSDTSVKFAGDAAIHYTGLSRGRVQSLTGLPGVHIEFEAVAGKSYLVTMGVGWTSFNRSRMQFELRDGLASQNREFQPRGTSSEWSGSTVLSFFVTKRAITEPFVLWLRSPNGAREWHLDWVEIDPL